MAFARLPGLLDHPQLLRRRPALAAGSPGDDFDPLILVRHKSVLENSIKPPGYAGCPVEPGASSQFNSPAIYESKATAFAVLDIIWARREAIRASTGFTKAD